MTGRRPKLDDLRVASLQILAEKRLSARVPRRRARALLVKGTIAEALLVLEQEVVRPEAGGRARSRFGRIAASLIVLILITCIPGAAN